MTRGTAAAFAALAASLWTMAWVPGGDATPWPALALWPVAFAAYAFAGSRAGGGSGGISGGASGGVSEGAIWGGAIALRLALVPALPSLSEDLYRYMWDGWVQIHGVNPFVYSPGAAELAPLRLEWWPLINHPDISTIYPPGAQLVFLSLAVTGPARIAFKLAWVAADLAAGWLVGRLARPGAARRRALLLYLWCPLLVVEVAWSGHLEPLGFAAAVGAALLARGADPIRAGALLGAGAAIKFAPLAALPVLWRRHGIRAAAVAVAVPALLYIPYAGAGAALFEGLGTYADVWVFNPGLFGLLEAAVGSDGAARGLAAGLLACVVALTVWRGMSLGRALYWILGAGVLLSPTIHPWYVLWVLPFACLYGGRGWILLTGTVFLAYAGRDAYLATGHWPRPAWLGALIHGPPLALLAWDGVRGLASHRFEGGDGVSEREQDREGEGALDPPGRQAHAGTREGEGEDGAREVAEPPSGGRIADP